MGGKTSINVIYAQAQGHQILNLNITQLCTLSRIYIHVFIQFNFNSYVYFRHKNSIYYKMYIQLVRINIMIYNNAIQSIRTKNV